MKARENPFRSERIESLKYRFQNGDWAALTRRLQALGYRAAIVGPHGTGKTTLLEELALHLAEAGYRIKKLFLNDQSPPLNQAAIDGLARELSGDTVVLFDGADLLDRKAWARLKRASGCAAGLIITAHRPGLLPTLMECRTTSNLLGELVSELLDAPHQGARHSERFARHRGNIREALSELYDIYARQAGPDAPSQGAP